jgi:membrane protein required for colicin V production
VTGFDFVLLAILGLSALLGLVRGLLKEVLSLVAYALAFLASVWWGPSISDWLNTWISQSIARMAIGYAGIFFTVLFGVGFINMTLHALLKKTGLTPADHGLGAMFGLLRGALFILVLITLAGYTPLPNEIWWKEAMFSKQVVGVVQHLKQRVPEPIQAWLPY